MSTQTNATHCSYPTRRRDGLLARLLGIAALYRSRRALSHLSDAQLDDIGVTRIDADREATRPIWDAPESWHR